MSFSHIIFCCVWVISMHEGFAQTTVGMGTENPNPNAVLELVPENLDQGFLAPRFTTQQRTAPGFVDKLTSKDNGLLVFDADEGKFYYWYDDEWKPGTSSDLPNGTGTVWYTGPGTPGNSEGKNGDFYIHTPSGDVFRKQNGIFSLIGNILPKENAVYSAGQGINIRSGNIIVNTGDLNPTNEIQDLQLSGDQLKITNNPAASNIDLSDYKNNDTNELIKEVNLSGETLRISDAGGDHEVDLSPLKAETPNLDNDPDNEIQDLQIASDKLSITNNSSATSIDLAPYMDNTDAQELSFAGNNLSISNGNSVDLSSLKDGTGTDDQNLGSSKTGNDVTVTIEDGSSTTFNVADEDNDSGNELITTAILDGDNQLIITEAGIDHIVDLDGLGGISLLGDGSSNNELITDVSLVGGNTLRITEAGDDYEVDFSSLQLSLNDGNILVGNATNQSAQVAVSGDATLTKDGAVTVTGLQGNEVATTAPTSGNVLTWNGSEWEPSPITFTRQPNQIFWFSSNTDPQATNFDEGEIGDLYFKYDDSRYWRRTGTNPGDWTEITGLGTISPNGKRMDGQLNTGSEPASADRQPGMLWLDSSGDGSIKRWTGSNWQTLISGND